MAQDIEISWVPPTQDTSNKPTTITKVTIYEMQPGNSTPVKVLDVVDSAQLAAKKVVLIGYYTVARPYTFCWTSSNADGESGMSPTGSDSVDVPQTGAAPGVKILPKP